MDVKIEESWKEQLKDEFEKDYFVKLTDFVRNEYRTKQIFPPAKFIFNAFDHTPFDKVKVVILGQDPYHNDGQAHGLSFSVPDGIQTPPSLVNIFKEINQDIGAPIPQSGNLTRWANQGVMLLNATLTVQAHTAGSHQKKGWEEFTDAAIRILDQQDRPMVFLLWGRPAQMKKSMLHRNPKHLILEAPHPSPLSAYRGFFGCKQFSQTNEFLKANGLEPIDWQIENRAEQKTEE